jgi:hypothetical protein
MLEINSSISVSWDDLSISDIDDQLEAAFISLEKNRREQIAWLLSKRNQRHTEIRNLLDICHGRIKS